MNEQDKDHLRARVATELGLAGSHKVELVVLPAMKVEMEAVTAARRAELAENIEEAFDARPERHKVRKTPTPLDDAAVLAVCSACRGSCCRSGETHAYLTREVLTRVRRDMKLKSEAAVLQAYLDRVPQRAHRESCIFHGARGCVLPRPMRSETCNRYLCYPIKQLGKDFARAGYAQVAVSRVADETPRALVLSEGSTRELRRGD